MCKHRQGSCQVTIAKRVQDERIGAKLPGGFSICTDDDLVRTCLFHHCLVLRSPDDSDDMCPKMASGQLTGKKPNTTRRAGNQDRATRLDVSSFQ